MDRLRVGDTHDTGGNIAPAGTNPMYATWLAANGGNTPDLAGLRCHNLSLLV